MANINNIKWERIPKDKARRYWNAADHTQIISRRYYDEHYGRLAATGLTNEQFAKKNKEENPLISALRPRRGKKSPTNNYSKMKRAMFGDARLAHGKTNIMIGSYSFTPQLTNFLEVFYTALKFNPRMLYYLQTTNVDEFGVETTTAHTHYSYLPKTVDSMLELFEMFDAFENKYKLRVKEITFNYRYKT